MVGRQSSQSVLRELIRTGTVLKVAFGHAPAPLFNMKRKFSLGLLPSLHQEKETKRRTA